MSKWSFVGIVVAVLAAHPCSQAADALGYGDLELEKWSRQPVLPVPLAAKAPVIDGRMDTEEWQGASVQSTPRLISLRANTPISGGKTTILS